ncbi:uncharacterized protein LOC126779785 [Nymphalis io]|uniref:uncharacterized protein LOC126779785 n=1 Tax=Inachis io TaxID=171585 RepID=UPI002169C709|nr:uncharacterized protein LOC126779785 [Nymphalis io]
MALNENKCPSALKKANVKSLMVKQYGDEWEKDRTFPWYEKLLSENFTEPVDTEADVPDNHDYDSNRDCLEPEIAIIVEVFPLIEVCNPYTGKAERVRALLDSGNNNSEIDNLLTKFWQLEEVPTKTVLSESEKTCEEHFLNNTFRTNTETISLLRKRFRKNYLLKSQYIDFINEYADLGHLSESVISNPENSYFLCHHAVYKESSESTKLRVVFDGSAATSSGFSLNNLLLVGPNLQDSLFSILIRARQHKYLLTGDIEKMYRQILVKDTDRDLQLILWRKDESLPLKTLRLNTVTYGTSSASYLSTRCLWQIGDECENSLIKNIIQKDFYVDDLITGADEENQLRFIKDSVIKALHTGCFNLRKFKSNLPNFQNDGTDKQDNLTFSESSNTLGLGWNPNNDNLHFPTILVSKSELITKRSIMSNSFKIFDPLGLLSPYIILVKIILQMLWKAKVDWDEPVPNDIKMKWENFNDNLLYLSKMQIPRRTICDSPKIIEFHSFSDASEVAFGACIYIRSVDQNHKFNIRLLCAKSKVARLQPMTIPRLELCAALLSASLISASLIASSSL